MAVPVLAHEKPGGLAELVMQPAERRVGAAGAVPAPTARAAVLVSARGEDAVPDVDVIRLAGLSARGGPDSRAADGGGLSHGPRPAGRFDPDADRGNRDVLIPAAAAPSARVMSESWPRKMNTALAGRRGEPSMIQ
jgi:hypothetical protein